MKKSILSFLVITGFALNAQQLENPSFENWEVENGKSEPVSWSSIQTGLPVAVSNLAPKVLFESSDAHSGSKSVLLENKSVFGIVANGIITNARVFADLDPTKGYIFTDINDPRWNTPLTLKPDSLVGWYKYEPTGVDVGSAIAILHTGEAKKPDLDSVNYVGSAIFDLPNSTISNWTRFSAPFNYFNANTPEYILLVITSGDGTQAVAGSIAYFDDIELIYNPVGIEERSIAVNVKAYGGQNSIKIDLSDVSSATPFEIKIYDIMGKEYYRSKMLPKTTKEFDQLIPGVYICTVSNGNQVITNKVMVY